jgi:cytoskeletal protein CcmA (bactofilin family)
MEESQNTTNVFSGGKTMAENDFPTIIGSDAKFKGDLSFDKSVKVLGSFEGRIDTKGDLFVASGGTLQADVEAGNIIVEGELNGNIAAKDMVELKESARLQGDLRCERLIVTEGARFVGHCSVGGEIPESPEGAPAKTPAAE